jgi:glucose/mannose transport system substrate-binding protein
MTAFNRKIRVFGVLAALAVGTSLGCGSSADGGNDDGAGGDGDEVGQIKLELFSWWQAPGEVEALSALIAAHKADYPDVLLSRVTVDNQEAPYLMAERFGFKCAEERTLDTTVDCVRDASITPNPVDLMQWNLGDVQKVWIDQGVKFLSLDEVLTEEKVIDQIVPQARDAVTLGGKIMALPVGIHRNNNLLFNRKVLAAAGVDPDGLKTWNDFIAACDKVQANGTTCLSTGTEGWIVNILFGNVLAMTMGAEGYRDYYTGKGNPDDPKLAEAVANFDMLMHNYVGDMKTLPGGWDEACLKMYDDEAAFYIHGDWAVGFLKARGWDHTDFGVIASPGSQGLFLYGVDGFLVPEGGKNTEAALDVIRTWSSPEALAAFAKAKGATPPRKGVDLSDDPLANGTYQDLLSAQFPMQEHDRGVQFQTYVDYVAGSKTSDDILAEVKAVYSK